MELKDPDAQEEEKGQCQQREEHAEGPGRVKIHCVQDSVVLFSPGRA